MFPNIEDYDTRDIRQLGLYAWKFDLFALRQLIEFNNDGLNLKIGDLCNEAIIANEIGDFRRHCDLTMETMSFHKIEPWMFQSTFLSLYSVVEASLDRHCDICQKQFNLSVRKEDLKDKGIARAVGYLEKVVEVEKITADNRWAKMLNLNKLRNDIIHRSGIVENPKNISLYKYEFNIELVDGKIYINYENMITIYEHIERFVEFIFLRDCKDKNRSFKI